MNNLLFRIRVNVWYAFVSESVLKEFSYKCYKETIKKHKILERYKTQGGD